jgi:hypothetical protein
MESKELACVRTFNCARQCSDGYSLFCTGELLVGLKKVLVSQPCCRLCSRTTGREKEEWKATVKAALETD